MFPIGLVATVVAVLLAEAAWFEVERRGLARDESRLRLLLRQKDDFAAQTPAPSAGNEASLAADVLRLRQEVTDLRSELFPVTEASESGMIEDGRLETFFELTALVARLRAAATAVGVAVAPGERFGFAAYANEGPTVALETTVRRQAEVAETVLGCLFAAQPRALLSVRRNGVEVAGASGSRRHEDHFVLAPGLSLRGSDHDETVALRVEFSGKTSALRRFLQGLASEEQVMAVRSIEVAPIGPVASGKGLPPGEVGGALVQPTESRFTVTIEAVDAPVESTP